MLQEENFPDVSEAGFLSLSGPAIAVVREAEGAEGAEARITGALQNVGIFDRRWRGNAAGGVASVWKYRLRFPGRIGPGRSTTYNLRDLDRVKRCPAAGRRVAGVLRLSCLESWAFFEAFQFSEPGKNG